MTEQNSLTQKAHEEIAKFEHIMQELRQMKNASRDLRKYRKMIRVRKND